MSNGWIKIHKQITEHWIWEDAERLKWWLDLLMLAAWEDGKTLVGGKLVEYHRGEALVSVRYLQDRWAKKDKKGHVLSMPSKKTITQFLHLLEQDGMVLRQNRVHQTTHLTICNYERYQCNDAQSGYTNGYTNGYKEEEYKNKKKNISLPQAASAYTHAYEGEDPDEKEKKLREQLLHGSDAWLETMAAKIHISTDAAKEKRERFVNETTIKDERHRDLRDIRSHFFNWLKIEIKSETKQTNINNQSNGTNNRTNNADAAEAARQKRMQEATELMQRYAAESGVDFDVRNIR